MHSPAPRSLAGFALLCTVGLVAIVYRQHRRDIRQLHGTVRDEIAAALVDGLRTEGKIIPLRRNWR